MLTNNSLTVIQEQRTSLTEAQTGDQKDPALPSGTQYRSILCFAAAITNSARIQ